MIEVRRCGKWISVVDRKNWGPKKHTRICEKHLVSDQVINIDTVE